MGHDTGKLERELRLIIEHAEGLLGLLNHPRLTTPAEFAMMLGASHGVATTMKTLATVQSASKSSNPRVSVSPTLAASS